MCKLNLQHRESPMARSHQAWSVTTGAMWVMPFNPDTPQSQNSRQNNK